MTAAELAWAGRRSSLVAATDSGRCHDNGSRPACLAAGPRGFDAARVFIASVHVNDDDGERRLSLAQEDKKTHSEIAAHADEDGMYLKDADV